MSLIEPNFINVVGPVWRMDTPILSYSKDKQL